MESEQAHLVTVPCADCGEPVVIDRPSHDNCPKVTHTGTADYGNEVPAEECEKVLETIRRREAMLRGEDEEMADLFRQCGDQLELQIQRSKHNE